VTTSIRDTQKPGGGILEMPGNPWLQGFPDTRIPPATIIDGIVVARSESPIGIGPHPRYRSALLRRCPGIAPIPCLEIAREEQATRQAKHK